MRARIDRYEIVGVLGHGAYGIVYLGHDPKLDREVAIKVLNDEVIEDEETRALFHREARAIAKLRHPNILELYDYSGPEAETPYLVVQRLEGENLDGFLAQRGRPLQPLAAAAAAHEICLALEHAHERGIVHRDLKPENIFIEPGGRVVLCDFGIARSFDPKQKGTLAGKNTQALGSPLFMSPEQIEAPDKVAPPSDLFALGSVLYFLVSGVYAFEEKSVVKIFENILLGQCKPLREVRPDLPPRFYSMIERLHRTDPAARFPSAKALAAELVTLMKEGGEADPRLTLLNTLEQLSSESKSHGRTGVTSFEDDEAAKTRIARIASGKRTDETQVGRATAIVSVTNVTTSPSVGTTTSRKRRGVMPMLAGGIAVVALVLVGLVLARPKRAPLEKPAIIATTPPPEPPSENLGTLPQPVNVDPSTVKPPPEMTPPPTRVRTPPAAGNGSLELIASPWADVWIDGVKAGTTPMFHETTLPAGRHKLRFVHPAAKAIERTVMIKSGDVTELAVEMEVRP